MLRHELESEDELVNVKSGLTAAVHWNQGNFDLLADELGNFAKERSRQWWWIGYEVAYLAVVRLKQSHTSEAMFHSFRSVEGLIPHSALQLLRHILVTKTRQFDDTTDRNSLIAVTQN